MPLSRTSNATDDGAWRATCSATLPWSVNLIALDSRFFRICSSRCGSVSIVAGASAATSTSRRKPLPAASGSNMERRPSASGASGVVSGRTSSLPASTFAMSRMSLIRASRSLPAAWMDCANFTCSGLRLPCALSASSFARISELFSGVRSSCDMLARNSDL